MERPISNTIKNKNWKIKIDQFKIDPNFKINLVEIYSLDETQLNLENN